MNSLQGKILLASSRLMDANFVHTVILMVQHDENGALGLVLNRPLELSVREACENALELPCEADGFIHQGGPCEGPLMVVHQDEDASQLKVFEGVFFTAEKGHIEGLLAEDGAKAKFFVGYSGWGPNQLEAEMQTGSWVTVAARKEYVFGENVDWQRLMTQATLGQYIDPNRIPSDPSVN
jgi:putative transcriptional regulator